MSPNQKTTPTIRQPDITLARRLLGWTPTIGLTDGLHRTIDWFRKTLNGVAARGERQVDHA